MYEDDLSISGMRNGVELADIFILILTTNVLTRTFCQKEINWAISAEKIIVLLNEEDPRFSVWDYNHFRNNEVWDAGAWISDCSKPYDSLATPELLQVFILYYIVSIRHFCLHHS